MGILGRDGAILAVEMEHVSNGMIYVAKAAHCSLGFTKEAPNATTLFSWLNAIFATALANGTPALESSMSVMEFSTGRVTYVALFHESVSGSFPNEARLKCDGVLGNTEFRAYKFDSRLL